MSSKKSRKIYMKNRGLKINQKSYKQMENNMWINKIKINNFRNYKNEEINLNKNINIFYGENAQGKTNIIEAIFLSSIMYFISGIVSEQLFAFTTIASFYILFGFSCKKELKIS